MDTPPPETPPPPPSGLLALILLPLQTALELGLRIFAALVAGVLGAAIPQRSESSPSEPEEG